ncbi:HAD hydrolase family protein [Bernardetia sp. MNP-M8]|uniref:KdsC family phosphatase n=1 Tax=Bernardetia sp. MNP-M8 TaxID=3127470 RepID=UPI0030D17677
MLSCITNFYNLNKIFAKMNASLKEKIQKIKIILTDVDGVLTDSKIIYDDNFLEYKNFNVKDGFIIKPLQKLGFKVGVITGRESDVVKKRCQELGFDFHYHGKGGINAKLETFEIILKENLVDPENIAYIGDDWIDLPILMRCGLSAAPQDAMKEVTERVDYITQRKGGEGALREFAQLILEGQEKLEDLIKDYL